MLFDYARRKSSRRAHKSKAGKDEVGSESADDSNNVLTMSRRAKKSKSGPGALDLQESCKSNESEPETDDSDTATFTPVKELPAIAKVQRGRKHKAFSPSGVLTPTLFSIIVSSITLCTLCFSCTSFDYVF